MLRHPVFSAAALHLRLYRRDRRIGVGLSAKYGWQAVFNTFGALAIAAEAYGLKAALGLRLLQNVFGVLFALVFCLLFSRMLARFSAPAENN